jgi:hypothetical protein
MRIFLLPGLLLLASTPAHATEIIAGIHAHGVSTPLSLQSDREGGVSVSAGVRGARIGKTVLQPYAFGSVNTRGDTNFLAAGLSARFGSDRLYVRPGLGIGIHDGSASKVTQPDRLAFGSRVLFEPEIAIGTRVTDRLSLEASWVHFSHAQIFATQNPGIDNIGVRLNWRM